MDLVFLAKKPAEQPREQPTINLMLCTALLTFGDAKSPGLQEEGQLAGHPEGIPAKRVKTEECPWKLGQAEHVQ